MIDASKGAKRRALHAQQRCVSAPAASGDADSLTVHRAFRYRLYPTQEQEAVLRQWSGVCRLVYNLGFEQRRDFYRQYKRSTGRAISFFSQGVELTPLRAEFDWIASAPAEAELYALRDLDRAFANFFSGRASYPKPRRRDQGHGFRVKGQSISVRILSHRWAEVRIPKLGWVRFRITRQIIGTVRNVSINCTAGHWHVSFAADREEAARPQIEGAVGVDLGVARTVTLSTGEHFSAPAADPTVRALARAQRQLARQKKGSARHAKQKARIAKLKAKAARARTDWAHKTTTDLAGRFGVVVVEDLNITNMTASAAGTVAEPGRGVAQKRGLNRAILAQSWGRLTEQLAYKLEERGGHLAFVDPKYTSQTCAACGVVDRESRESQARFSCIHCGHEDNADVNAAKEILRRGTSGRGVEADVGRPAKRQSQEVQHV